MSETETLDLLADVEPGDGEGAPPQDAPAQLMRYRSQRRQRTSRRGRSPDPRSQIPYPRNSGCGGFWLKQSRSRRGVSGDLGSGCGLLGENHGLAAALELVNATETKTHRRRPPLPARGAADRLVAAWLSEAP